MNLEDLVLRGRHIRLEPLAHHHVSGLVAAASADPSLYRWSPVPQGEVETAVTSIRPCPGKRRALLCRLR